MRRAVVVAFSCLASSLTTFASLTAQAAPDAAATVALSGRVVDWQGKPIAGAGVAFAPRDTLTTAQLLAESPLRTGADGRFTLRAPRAPETDELAWPVLLIAAKGMAAVAPPVNWKQPAAPPGTSDRPREDTDLGDIVLPEGARLFGRVRDAEGKGIAGAQVTLRDLLDNHRALSGSTSSVFCRAVSNASGIFELPCGLAQGAIVEITAKGHFRQTLHAVGAGVPLEVSLQPGGRVAGRVVDDKGGLVGGALVRITYERRGDSTRVRAAADGTFELPLEHPGRYRVGATRPRVPGAPRSRTAAPTAESPVLTAPVANLELTLAAAAPGAGEGALRVQAVAAGSKQPVNGVRALGIWQPFALQNAAYLDYLATMYLQGTAPSEGNEVPIKGPGENESRTGAVRVEAAGYAPAVQRDVEWPEADKLAEAKPIVVELVREATVAGRVVDERTGAPIAGARIWAMRRQDPNQGRFGAADEAPDTAVVSAADGSYRLGQLGEGDWTLRVRHAERPRPAPVDITLKPEEQQTGVDLKLAGGARVAGRVTGLTIPVGSKVFLHPIAVPRFGSYQSWSSGGMGPTEGRVPLATDGTFAFDGVALASFYLVLELPSPPRGGGARFVPLEPLRVRAEGVQRDFDGAIDTPGRIGGTVTWPRAVPEGVVPVVVAEQVSDNPDEQVFLGHGQYAGPRTFVRADGTFELPVVRGTHRLRVVDAATGISLLLLGERIAVAAGGDVTRELAVPLTEVVVTLTPPADAGPFVWIDRLEVRHQPAKNENPGVVFGGNDEYDNGIGLPVAAGTTSLRLWLPEGKVSLLARGSAGNLKTGKERGRQGPLGREEFDLAADEKSPKAVTIKVEGPPDLGGAPAKVDADAGAAKQDGR